MYEFCFTVVSFLQQYRPARGVERTVTAARGARKQDKIVPLRWGREQARKRERERESVTADAIGPIFDENPRRESKGKVHWWGWNENVYGILHQIQPFQSTLSSSAIYHVLLPFFFPEKTLTIILAPYPNFSNSLVL